MAIRYEIELSTTEPNNDIGLVKIRQADEQTQTLDVTITENGLPRAYRGLQPFFCAKLGQSAGLGIIEQKLKSYESLDPASGKLEYTLRAEDWQQIGRQIGYFSFRKMKDDHEYIEQFSTRDFYYTVTKNVFSDGVREVKKDGSTYVWTIEDLIRLFNEYVASGKTDWEEFVENNKEIIESVDPGGKVLREIIDARGPHESLKGKLEASSNSAYIDDVNQWNRYDDEAKTNYFVTEIPAGSKIKQFFHARGQQKTARETDRIIGTATVVMNAGMTANAELSGLYIHDGKVICENEYLSNYWILAWNAKNEWGYYKNGAAAADQIIADGFDQAITAFTPLIWDGRRHEEGIKIYQEGIPDTIKNPHQIIAIKADGTILTVCCDGRDIVGSNGWNCSDAVRILLSLDVDKAFMLDGGGSTQTVVRGIQVNHNHDNSGKVERAMRHYLYFEKDLTNEKNKLQLEDIKVSQFTGKLGKRVSDAEVDLYRVQTDFKKYNPNIMPWLTENTDLLSLPAGIYEGTRPKHGLPDDSIYIYQIYQSKISSRKMIKATRSFDGAVFNRTIHTEGTPVSGSGGWKRVYPLEEILFIGGASLEHPVINLERSILDFNYIWVQYAFNQLSKEMVRIRLPKIGEPFVLRPSNIAEGNYAMLDRTVVQIVDSQTLKITEDASFGIDTSAKIGIVNNKSNIWISKISGDYDPTIKIKGWGE